MINDDLINMAEGECTAKHHQVWAKAIIKEGFKYYFKAELHEETSNVIVYINNPRYTRPKTGINRALATDNWDEIIMVSDNFIESFSITREYRNTRLEKLLNNT